MSDDDLLVHEESPYNAETLPAALVGRQVTPTGAFYVRNHGPVPTMPTDASIAVGGLVERPFTVEVADLIDRFGAHEVTATLQCAGNRRSGFLDVKDIPGETPWGPGATGTARWRGVRLRDVLQAAGVDGGATHVAFTGADVSEAASPPSRFGASIPLTKGMADEVLLAVEMNDEPLSPEHGAPARVVVPGWIGARSVKWLTDVEVLDAPSDNWFQAVSYRLLPAEADPSKAGPGDGISLGPVALNCDILAPTEDEELVQGAITVQGYAYAGADRIVARVDVSTDGGASWEQARLSGAPDPWTWRLWSHDVHLGPGSHTILARAWDDTAAAQPEHAAPLWNPKGYANNSWARVSIRVR